VRIAWTSSHSGGVQINDQWWALLSAMYQFLDLIVASNMQRWAATWGDVPLRLSPPLPTSAPLLSCQSGPVCCSWAPPPSRSSHDVDDRTTCSAIEAWTRHRNWQCLHSEAFPTCPNFHSELSQQKLVLELLTSVCGCKTSST